MATRNFLVPTQGYGAQAIAAIRFVPGASPTTQESWGISSLTRNNAGDYTIALLGKPRAFIALVQVIENDTTHFHFARVESYSESAGTITISHKSVAFASVASGPTLSDTVDGIVVVVFERKE